MNDGLFIPPPAGGVEINRDETDVWRASLVLSQGRLQQLKSYLSADELKRAERFYLQGDRDRYIATHGLLRSILSLYTGIEPCRLGFDCREDGKPTLRRVCETEELRFNLSHSGEICVFAVARDTEVGIDIERIRRDVAVEDIAEKFFSARERSLLSLFPFALRHDAFFVWWTCKEAYAKATGEQLSFLLEKLDVSIASKRSRVVIGDQSQSWSLQTISAVPSYAAALVTQGERKRIRYWEWPEDLA